MNSTFLFIFGVLVEVGTWKVTQKGSSIKKLKETDLWFNYETTYKNKERDFW